MSNYPEGSRELNDNEKMIFSLLGDAFKHLDGTKACLVTTTRAGTKDPVTLIGISWKSFDGSVHINPVAELISQSEKLEDLYNPPSDDVDTVVDYKEQDDE